MTEKQRAAALRALATFQQIAGVDTLETDITDLITNTLLFAKEVGLDADAILRMASSNYEVERGEGNG